MTGVVTTAAAIGSSPNRRHSSKVSSPARTSRAPWATLMMFMTPKIRVRPEAISAYTPPTSRPRMSVSVAWVTAAGLPRLALLPVGLGEHHAVGGGHVLGQHDLGLAALPLGEQEVGLRRAGRVPAQRAEDGVDLVGVQPVGDLVLVDLPAGLDAGLQHLRGGERVGGVLLRDLVVLLLVAPHEVLVERVGGLGAPADRVEHALGVGFPDALGVLVGVGRRRGLE